MPPPGVEVVPRDVPGKQMGAPKAQQGLQGEAVQSYCLTLKSPGRLGKAAGVDFEAPPLCTGDFSSAGCHRRPRFILLPAKPPSRAPETRLMEGSC